MNENNFNINDSYNINTRMQNKERVNDEKIKKSIILYKR